MLLPAILLLIGLLLLLGGGDILVRGASGLAAGLRVSPLVIGLTVVAMGTSAPELAVNVIAAWRGSSELSFGNIMGSNLANLGLVLGGTAVLCPLVIRSEVNRREIPMMLLATLVAVVLAFDAPLRGGHAAYDRADALVLLSLLGLFVYYTVLAVLQGRAADTLAVEAAEAGMPLRRGLARNAVLTAAGLAGLAGGGRVTVGAAVALAEGLGVPEAIIGLTVIAVGTSLPELATAVIAARHGETDLAVGNVVGSNILNLVLVLGFTALVRPVPVPAGGAGDLIMLGVVSLALVPLALTGSRLVRGEGALLLAAYLGYMAWRVL